MVRYHRLEIETEPDHVSLKAHRRALYTIIAGSSILFLLLAYAALPTWSPTIVDKVEEIPTQKQQKAKHLSSKYVEYKAGDYWHGWSGVERMIILGDSYSSTGYDIDGTRPSQDNPLGNPAYPGYTVTDGENWVDFLIYHRNESQILALDLAVGGATIDSDLIKPPVPSFSLRPLKTQIDEYISYPEWQIESALFVMWVGVNDIIASKPDTRDNFEAEFKEYADLLNTLYDHKARNFFFINAPPLDRAPMAKLEDDGTWKGMVENWNKNLTSLISNFNHEDTTIFHFNAFQLYVDIFEDPTVFPETAGLEVVDDVCNYYAFGALTPTYKDPNCPYSVDKYFWINDLHPSTQTHNATAHAIVDALKIADDHL